MGTFTKLAAIGAGAYAYSKMDQKTKKRLRKQMSNVASRLF
ncbi:hypothetical protein ACERII_07625 [Evansella sp. AB-rgal1]